MKANEERYRARFLCDGIRFLTIGERFRPLESTFAGIRMLSLKALPDEKKDELRA